MDNKQHKRAINAWAMYDWANSGFATTIMAAVLPVYYSTVAASSLEPYQATSAWGYTTTIALLFAALLTPILGTYADVRGSKKKLLSIFVMIGVLGTALLFFVQTGDWLKASIFYIIGNIGFSGSLVFYDSLLPHIASPEEIDKVSSKGYALGYLGGGILLAVNVAMIMLTPDNVTALMTRLSFVTVAVWWLVFSSPVLRVVTEPPHKIIPGEEKANPLSASFARLGETFRKLKSYRQLFKFIVAFWLYNNGIGTIITMAVIYGTELGFDSSVTIGTLLMVQFVAVPFAFLFGWLAKKIGAKHSIYVSLVIYTLIAIAGYFTQEAWHFYVLGFAVGTVQGGSQALSRSLFGRMLPKSQSAEFFSFFAVSEKIAGVAGPFVFATVSAIMKASRLSIVSLIIFFALGGFLLSKVDVEEGIRVAQEEEARLTPTTA
ncbi:MAG: MFS transporter [Anaerolineaceae bacterium]|nr:MFS transporter [Anaerolineaceae bacterium]